MSLLLSLFVASTACAAAPVTAPAPTFEELWREGTTFDAFLESAKARRELWLKNWGRAVVSPELERRARAAGDWKLLVVAVDRCSDSVSTLPYVAKLAEVAPNLELRIIDPERGREIMEAHRTPDGRAATPTFILLDGAYEERGCFVERPSELQRWWLANEAMAEGARVDRKMEWYDADLGASTLREVVEVMEAAAQGGTRCG